MAGVETVFYRKHGELIVIRSAEEEFKGNATTQPLYRKPDLPQFYSPPPLWRPCSASRKAQAPEQTCLFAYPLPKNRGVTNTGWHVPGPKPFRPFFLFFFSLRHHPKSFSKTLLTPYHKVRKVARVNFGSLFRVVTFRVVLNWFFSWCEYSQLRFYTIFLWKPTTCENVLRVFLWHCLIINVIDVALYHFSFKRARQCWPSCHCLP